MKVFKLIVPINENPVLNKNFIKRNEKRYKIIFNNKILPLNNILTIPNDKRKEIKIKIICYSDNYHINDIIIANETLNVFKISKNYKKQLEYPKLEGSKIFYKINRKETDIRIFGKNFVNNNRGKYLILYKDKTFPLNEFFYIKDIDKEDDKLEISLVELKNIIDRSFMFENCNYLEDIFFFEKDKKESIEYSLDKESLNLEN